MFPPSSISIQPRRPHRDLSGAGSGSGGAKPPTELWPADVDMILSALDAGQHSDIDRRLGTRMPYRVRATLGLYSDPSSAEPWVLYTRDVDTRGIGFISPQRLPLGYGGEVELFSPRGEVVCAACTILRCREAAVGWYEGALHFNREQWMFQME